MATPRSSYYFGGSENVSVGGSGSTYANTFKSVATTKTSTGYTTKGLVASRSNVGNTHPSTYNQNINATYNIYGDGGSGGYGGTRTIVKIIKPEVKKFYTDGSLLGKLPKPTKTEYAGLKGDKDMFGWSLLGNWLDWLEKNKSAITKQYVL